MKNYNCNRPFLIGGLLVIAALILASVPAHATPSTTFYTPATAYIQPFKVPHITYDNYFNRNISFPEDVGLTIGFLPWKKFQAEAGFDLFYPGRYPLQLNIKAGVPEEAFFKHSPGLTAGMFGIGFKNGVNNFDIAHMEIGSTIPKIGTFTVGGYKGFTRDLMRSSDGGMQDAGFMIAYYRTLEPLTDRVAITADYMSGKNILGGGGVGMYFFFTKQIDLLMGWVWFNDTKLNPPEGMFTIQLDIDFDFKRMLPK